MPRGVPKNGYRKTKNLINGKRVVPGVNAPAMAMAPIVESRFTINERFDFVADMVTMLAKGDQASVVVCGPGGLGKSWTVLHTLLRLGMKDITNLADFHVGELIDTKRSFTVIKGYSTPKGLYRALYENKDGILIYDDCDSVLKDPVSLGLLKGALDSYSKRIISWRADFKDDELPQSFEFKGRVVCITNKSSVELDQAILTRSMVVDLSMTTDQKVARMRHLLDSKEFMPEFEMKFKQDAMDLISELQDRVKELSLRTLIQVTKIRKAASANRWKALAEYTICG